MKSALLIIGSIAVFLVAFKYPGIDDKNEAEGGIQFYKGSFSDAIQLAKKENKFVFLDIYATWCGPCNMLKSKTFSDGHVGAYFNSQFVNVALNGEEGEGAAAVVKYGVEGYPTLLFFDPDGKVIYGISGYHNPKDFLKLGKTIINK